MKLIGATLDTKQIPEDDLLSLHSSLAGMVAAWRGEKPVEPSQDSILKLRSLIGVNLKQTYKYSAIEPSCRHEKTELSNTLVEILKTETPFLKGEALQAIFKICFKKMFFVGLLVLVFFFIINGLSTENLIFSLERYSPWIILTWLVLVFRDIKNTKLGRIGGIVGSTMNQNS